MPITEIVFHGRGGQGAVTSSQILAIAAFYDGKYSQSFPNFGVERSGAPVESYTRISNNFINLRQHVYNPTYVLVLDSSLINTVDVTKGLQRGGMIIVNTNKKAEELELKGDFKVKTIDITRIAVEVIGKPFVNIASLGALSEFTKIVSVDAIKKAIDEKMGNRGKIAELNKAAVQKVAECCKGS